jgi:hypothetical protein
MTPNPFRKLLNELFTGEFQPVTLQLLETVTHIVNEPSTVVQTYGEAFQTLEFLAQARAVELIPIEAGSQQYKIRKL